jgi:drug/metabolite transporter (DMT)-like permease
LRRYLPITVAILIWAWTAIFIKLLQGAAFDPFVQNFYRYLAASVVLLVLTRLANPEGFRRALRRPWVFALTGLAMAGFQTFWVLGVYRVTPAFAGIIGTSDMILIMLIAMFFADERRMVCNARFVLTIAAGLVAVVAFIALDPRASFAVGSDAARFLTGAGLVLLGSAMWVVFAYLSKWLVKGHGAMVVFSFSSVFAVVLLLAVAVAEQLVGDAATGFGHIAEVRWPFVLLLLGSGVLNVGVAQSLFQRSILYLGVSLTRGMELAIPLLTALFSYLVFRERLTAPQWACGIVVLGSVGYLTVLGRRLAANGRGR